MLRPNSLITGTETKKSANGDAFELTPWHCPVCLKAEQKFIGYRGGDYQREHLGIKTSIVQCRSCSLLFPNPFPVAVDAQSLYGDPETYFSGHDPTQKIAANRKILLELQTRLGRIPKVLDVGCGCGELLVAAKLEKMEAVGIEISDSMIEFAKSNNQVEVHRMTIEEAAATWPQSFDGVILNAVLEHVYNPDSMIAAASSLLKPGGMLYIDVPNEPNLLTKIGNTINRLMGSRAVFNLSPTWAPFHVYGFNPKSLKILLRKHGLAVDQIVISSHSEISSHGDIFDRTRTWLANQLNFLANLTGTAGNLSLWGTKKFLDRENN